MTEKNPLQGKEPVKATATVNQIATTVKFAAVMANNRLYPKWDGTAGKLGYAAEITWEALFYVNEFKSGEGISTLMV